MRGSAADGGYDARSDGEAANIGGRGIRAYENNRFTAGDEPSRALWIESSAADRNAGGCAGAANDRLSGYDQPFVGERLQIEAGEALQCFGRCNPALLHEIYCQPQRCLRRSFRCARLQHPQLAVLDGEFDVLYIGKVLLEPPQRFAQLRGDLSREAPVQVVSSGFGVVSTDTTSSPWESKSIVMTGLATPVEGRAKTRRRRPTKRASAEHHRLNVTAVPRKSSRCCSLR